MVQINNDKELDELLRNWKDTPQQTKKAFLQLKDHLSQKTGSSPTACRNSVHFLQASIIGLLRRTGTLHRGGCLSRPHPQPSI